MKKLVMIGTQVEALGGISSVVNVYRAAGLFDRFPIVNLPAHCDGSVLAKLKIMLSAYTQFLWLLLIGRVGLLHVHVASRTSFWRKSIFFILAFLFGVPTILHLHGGEFTIFYEKECGRFRKYLIRYVFNKATRIVVLSSTWKAWVQSISANPHVEAIYNPVVLPDKAHVWEACKYGTVLFLGQIRKQKGVYDLLEAAAKVAAVHSEFRLLLGGDGELKQVQARAEELGINNKIELLGWVKGSDKERYLAEAMIFVLPSYNEGLPMSVLEAMAEGLPIISTSIGGIPEAVTDGVEGFLIEPSDIEALTARLSQLLHDPDLARRMGEAAHRKAETVFSSDAVLPRLERLYTELGFIVV
jgi:glycosyltransferase involved in cell wall biosynthesis